MTFLFISLFTIALRANFFWRNNKNIYYHFSTAMHYIYILQSVIFPDQIYVGCTRYLDERIIEHNEGMSPHTARYRPWKLHAYMAMDAKNKAFNFEKYLKSHSGRAFLQKRLV
jgi:putative endonuclease